MGNAARCAARAAQHQQTFAAGTLPLGLELAGFRAGEPDRGFCHFSFSPPIPVDIFVMFLFQGRNVCTIGVFYEHFAMP